MMDRIRFRTSRNASGIRPAHRRLYTQEDVLSEGKIAQETQLQPLDAAALKNTGKVLAVHLSYNSRAAQRGRVPANPSYFMKASSSLSLTGGTVERPAGPELLAFEGEVALGI